MDLCRERRREEKGLQLRDEREKQREKGGKEGSSF